MTTRRGIAPLLSVVTAAGCGPMVVAGIACAGERPPPAPTVPAATVPVPTVPVPTVPVPPVPPVLAPLPPVSGSSAVSASGTVKSFGSATATLTSPGAIIVRLSPVDARSARPDLSLGLTARSAGRGRYVLRAVDIRCIGAADWVLMAVDGSRRAVACHPGATVSSPPLQTARLYSVAVQAVAMRGRRVTARGPEHAGTIRAVAPRRRAAIIATATGR